MTAEVKNPDINKVWAESGDKTNPGDPKIDTGWAAEIPTRQNMNWLQNLLSSFCKHINQEGVPVWDATTEYFTNGLTKGSDGKIYQSNVDNNVGNDPVSSPTEWNPDFIGGGGISWSIQGANFNAEVGNGYLAVGGITVTLPSSPSEGDQIILADYTSAWDSSAITVNGNGNDIEGSPNRNFPELDGVVNLVFSGTQWERVGKTVPPYAGSNGMIRLNPTNINENINVPAGYNGSSAGPITVDSGFTVTVETGSTWVVV